jgi:hypothetical protein
MMTRKDYVKFAEMVKTMKAKLKLLSNAHDVLDDMAENMAIIFQDDNPNFNRARFLEACGVNS